MIEGVEFEFYTAEHDANPFANFKETSKGILEISIGIVQVIIGESDVGQENEEIHNQDEDDLLLIKHVAVFDSVFFNSSVKSNEEEQQKEYEKVHDEQDFEKRSLNKNRLLIIGMGNLRE